MNVPIKKINSIQLKQLIEASLFIQTKPVNVKTLKEVILAGFSVSRERINIAIEELIIDYQERGVQLIKVAGGYRFQTRDSLSELLQPLWHEQAPKYSKATLETLAIIAYRQPVTRGDIEQVRGVAISSAIIKNLTDRGWIRVVGHKDVPGRPSLLATTTTFLAYFGLDSLAELPPLSDAESLQEVFSGIKNPVESKKESTNE